uniref:Uncharacterized protein n=1 Tax=Rhizophora mucronata TaxID=61149 RepID=A0A2P2IQ54_RHIMU
MNIKNSKALFSKNKESQENRRGCMKFEDWFHIFHQSRKQVCLHI